MTLTCGMGVGAFSMISDLQKRSNILICHEFQVANRALGMKLL